MEELPLELSFLILSRFVHLGVVVDDVKYLHCV
jgi:hypothetical protein